MRSTKTTWKLALSRCSVENCHYFDLYNVLQTDLIPIQKKFWCSWIWKVFWIVTNWSEVTTTCPYPQAVNQHQTITYPLPCLTQYEAVFLKSWLWWVLNISNHSDMSNKPHNCLICLSRAHYFKGRDLSKSGVFATPADPLTKLWDSFFHKTLCSGLNLLAALDKLAAI